MGRGASNWSRAAACERVGYLLSHSGYRRQPSVFVSVLGGDVPPMQASTMLLCHLAWQTDELGRIPENCTYRLQNPRFDAAMNRDEELNSPWGPGSSAWTATTQEVLALLGRKWVTPIVRELLEGPRRHFQLRHAIRGIQPKVLRETLRFMERDGAVRRVLHDDGVGGRGIAYELTSLGCTLMEPMSSAFEWGRLHLDEVHAHRQQQNGSLDAAS